jgi:hypothetical protein
MAPTKKHITKDLIYLSYWLDDVPPKSKFYLFIYLQQAILIGASLKKNETTEAPLNRRFDLEV